MVVCVCELLVVWLFDLFLLEELVVVVNLFLFYFVWVFCCVIGMLFYVWFR